MKTTSRRAWMFAAVVGVAPDYRYVMAQVSADKPANISLHAIYNGDWQFLYVIGAYNDPVAIVKAEAAARKVHVGLMDAVSSQLFGAAPVEENEGAISFVDGAGRSRTVLVDGFERIASQHVVRCFGRDADEITLPV